MCRYNCSTWYSQLAISRGKDMLEFWTLSLVRPQAPQIRFDKLHVLSLLSLPRVLRQGVYLWDCTHSRGCSTPGELVTAQTCYHRQVARNGQFVQHSFIHPLFLWIHQALCAEIRKCCSSDVLPHRMCIRNSSLFLPRSHCSSRSPGSGQVSLSPLGHTGVFCLCFWFFFFKAWLVFVFLVVFFNCKDYKTSKHSL